MFDDEATVESVVDMAIYITNEAFYTPAPLLYSPKEMAISAVIMACKHLKLQCPLSEGYDFQAMADRLNTMVDSPQAEPDEIAKSR